MEGKQECRVEQERQGNLLVDVSTLVQVDDGSGIQRVVWNILFCLLRSPPRQFRVRPVYRSHSGYRYAETFTAQIIQQSSTLKDLPVCFEKGDIFLGLDFDHMITSRALRFLQRQQQKNGLEVYFVVYDLLAVTHPEWFNQHLSKIIGKWLQNVSAVADGLICISESVALELKQYLGDHNSATEVKIGFFHLGADLAIRDDVSFLTADESAFIRWLSMKTVFLMIGTLEPRKGHQQVLDAMARLWQDGEDVLLVMAGKKGWKVERLVKAINLHPENGRHLFWLENVSDAFLMQLYTHSSALIMASEGEGFGLPLIEAVQYQLPLIVRDLPVFREVAGENAFYFSGISGHDLQRSLSDWLLLFHQDKHPVSSGLQWQTWQQSSEQLLNVMLHQKWI